jgi:two-component system invasion response regulator UvrY
VNRKDSSASARNGKRNPDQPLRFLIVDDYEIVRSGLRRALSGRFNNATFEFAPDGDGALAACSGNPFDVILVDLGMPGRNGVELLAELRVHCPRASILILTLYPEERLARLAIAAGAAGFIEKSATMPALIRAVEKVLKGGIYLSEKLARQLSIRLEKTRRADLRQIFSPLEMAVFVRIAAGRTSKQIRAELARTARQLRDLEIVPFKSNGP